MWSHQGHLINNGHEFVFGDQTWFEHYSTSVFETLSSASIWVAVVT